MEHPFRSVSTTQSIAPLAIYDADGPDGVPPLPHRSKESKPGIEIWNRNTMTDSSSVSNQTAACCANFYEQDLVQEFMGGSFHPGGITLSKQLIQSMALAENAKTLDVACGVGTTARIMAELFGYHATGVDFSNRNIAKASEMTLDDSDLSADEDVTACCGPGESCCDPADPIAITIGGASASEHAKPERLGGSLRFVQGSADRLPFDDAAFDGVTCECAVSTFVNQEKVADEFCRVLTPGGIFGMTDMALAGTLPEDFSRQAASWTCVARAMSTEQYQALFETRRFELIDVGDHSDCLIELATEIKRKLVMSGFGAALGALPALDLSLSEMRSLLKQSTELVKAGTIQYKRLVFRKR
jgi:ubiquinone/menaquinone biosynthesis C-methylase UbiE